MINEGMLVWVPPWIEQSGTLLPQFFKKFFWWKTQRKRWNWEVASLGEAMVGKRETLPVSKAFGWKTLRQENH